MFHSLFIIKMSKVSPNVNPRKEILSARYFYSDFILGTYMRGPGPGQTWDEGFLSRLLV